jgi:hypothetical protein
MAPPNLDNLNDDVLLPALFVSKFEHEASKAQPVIFADVTSLKTCFSGSFLLRQ